MMFVERSVIIQPDKKVESLLSPLSSPHTEFKVCLISRWSDWWPGLARLERREKVVESLKLT